MYIILKVEKNKSKKIEELYKDDIVSRQTIIRREALSLGLNEENIYIQVEGSEEGISRAKEISKDFAIIPSQNEMEKIYKKFKEQDESSLEGMGSIFG